MESDPFNIDEGIAEYISDDMVGLRRTRFC